MSVKYCPKCGADSYVINTRADESGRIRRRRECPFCGERWSTIEIFLDEKDNKNHNKNITKTEK